MKRMMSISETGNGGKEPLLSKPSSTLVPNTTDRRNKLHRSKSTPAVVLDAGATSSNPREAAEHSTVRLRGKNSVSLTRAHIIGITYLGLGVICFLNLEPELKGRKTANVVDALYFCIVTMTTLGYGDILPQGIVSKLFVCAYVISGVTLVGVYLNSAADYLVDQQEKQLIKAVASRRHRHRHNRQKGHEKMDEAPDLGRQILSSALILSSMVMIGVVGSKVFEGLGILDSFYLVCCTVTTLGFGDTTFGTEMGRIFAIFWIPASIVCVGHFIMRLAEVRTVRKQHEMVNWVLRRPTTTLDLEAADLDCDGAVSPAEFVIYKLKEMGKIKQEDVILLLKEFDKLDVNDSRKLLTP